MTKEKINALIDRYAMTKGPLNRVDLQIFAYAVLNEAHAAACKAPGIATACNAILALREQFASDTVSKYPEKGVFEGETK
jgi:hypothetical protein